MIGNRDVPALITDRWGRFRSVCLRSPTMPSVGPGDDGFLWIDIGVDGTPANPLWKMWDDEAQTWRLVGGGAGTINWDDVIGKPAVFPPEAHVHLIHLQRGWFSC